MATIDEKNYEWFKNNLPKLMEKHRGKYLIIINEALSGCFETFDEALAEALKTAKPGEFLIQRCISEEENAEVFCSVVRLPNFS